jgi:hypothetical protein
MMCWYVSPLQGHSSISKVHLWTLPFKTPAVGP